MNEVIEKSAEEQLADVVKTEVAAVADTKADVTALEEVKAAVAAIEVPAVDGFVKSEELAAANEAVAELKSELEALNVKLDAAPAFVAKEEIAPMTYVMKQSEGDEKLFELSAPIIKAELTPNNAADAPIGNAPIYADLVEANPFRTVANVFAVSSASYKIPKLSAVAGNKNENAGSQTEGSAVADVTVNVNDYNSLSEINMNLADDLPGLDAMVMREQVMQVGLAEHTDIVSVLDGATVTEVDAGIGDDDLADVATYQSLISSLPNQYWMNATWAMSPEAYAKLLGANHSGTGSPLVIDPVSGGFTLYGRPIIVSGEMDAGTAANQNPVYFGDFRRALWIGSRQDMQFTRYTENKIGAFSYYTHMRSGQSVVEAAGLRRLNMTA